MVEPLWRRQYEHNPRNCRTSVTVLGSHHALTLAMSLFGRTPLLLTICPRNVTSGCTKSHFKFQLKVGLLKYLSKSF